MHPSTPAQTYPVRRTDGGIIANLTRRQIASAHGITPIFSKHGKIVGALATPDSPWTLREMAHRHPSSRRGAAFEQPVASGHVWALRGVPGS